MVAFISRRNKNPQQPTSSSAWSCIGHGCCCASTKSYSRNRFTDSQMLGLALVMAEQYVRVAESTDSLSTSSHSDALRFSEKQTLLPLLPMRSTRTKDNSRQRRPGTADSDTVFSGSDGEINEIRKVAGQQQHSRKPGIFRIPARWLKRKFSPSSS